MKDPVELMEARVEDQIALVDAAGTYPCCQCGTRTPLDDIVPVSADPAAPGLCLNCMGELFKI